MTFGLSIGLARAEHLPSAIMQLMHQMLLPHSRPYGAKLE